MSTSQGSERARLRGWRAAVIWLVVGADILAVVLANTLDPTLLVISLLLLSVVASFGVVGSIIFTRRPRNPIGWILWMTATVIAWSIAGVVYATYSIESFGGALPGTIPIAVVASVDIVPMVGMVAIFVPLLFPDGHLLSPRWRPVAWLGLVSLALTTLFIAITPGTLSGGVEIQNPIGIRGLDGWRDTVGVAVDVALGVAVILAMVSLVRRYRRGGQTERQQLRWFGYAVLVMAIAVVLGTSDTGPLAANGWLVMLAGMALVPLAIGVAILRFRLYDLDRLISRTISYGVITAVLIGFFLLVNLGLQSILSSFTSGNSLAVAGSTLLAAALFTPVRRRVQRIVDRRFDRARYDGERTASAFSVRMRDATDLPTVAADLDITVRRAIAPSSVGLWLRVAKR